MLTLLVMLGEIETIRLAGSTIKSVEQIISTFK